MSAVLLALAGAVMRAVLLVVIVAGVAAVVWVLRDCLVGESARLAAAHRAGREVDGR